MVSLMKGLQAAAGTNSNNNKKSSRKHSLQVSRGSKGITKSDHLNYHLKDGDHRNTSRSKKVIPMPSDFLPSTSVSAIASIAATSAVASIAATSAFFSKLTSSSATSLVSASAPSSSTSRSSCSADLRSAVVSDLQRSLSDQLLLHHHQSSSSSLSQIHPSDIPRSISELQRSINDLQQQQQRPLPPLSSSILSSPPLPPPSPADHQRLHPADLPPPLGSKYITPSGLVVTSSCENSGLNLVSVSSSSGGGGIGRSSLVSDLLSLRSSSKCEDLVEVNLSTVHRSSDLGSSDEMKVWKDEGEQENEMNFSEQLQAELQEDPGIMFIPPDPPDPPGSPMYLPGKLDPDGPPFTPPGYLGLPYSSYPPPHLSRSGSPTFFYQEHLGSPPPAHMGGIPYSLEPHKGLRGYPFTSQYNPYLSPDLTSCAISRFSSGLFGGPGFPGSPPLSPPKGLPLLNQVKLEPGLHHGNKKPHIKKPLNAFMLYMKEMRPKVVAECTLKESAAINQILGRKWHALTREEQAKYYEQARKERQIHMQLYPGWSARDNYAQSKKKKRKREKNGDMQGTSGGPLKKCRGRQGFDQADLWYRPCKPEEAIDGAGDTIPLFSQQPPGSGYGGPSSVASTMDSGGTSPLSLVTCGGGEPLLDLRSFSQMNSSLLNASVNVSHGGLGPPNVLSVAGSLGPCMSPTGNMGPSSSGSSSSTNLIGVSGGITLGPGGSLSLGPGGSLSAGLGPSSLMGSLDPSCHHTSPELSYPSGGSDPTNHSPKYICL